MSDDGKEPRMRSTAHIIAIVAMLGCSTVVWKSYWCLRENTLFLKKKGDWGVQVDLDIVLKEGAVLS